MKEIIDDNNLYNVQIDVRHNLIIIIPIHYTLILENI